MSDEKDGVSPEETEVDQPTLLDEEEAEEEFHPFDEFQEDFKPTRTGKVLAEDGMPTQDAEVLGSNIPPLSPETLICMEDRSQFVRRDSLGRIQATFSAEVAEQLPNGNWYLKEDLEVDLEQAMPVEPIRPSCEHYVRQQGQGGDNPEMKVHYRLCAARRTTEGAFMSVRDTGMWACTMREPRDPDSEKRHLDLFDETKIQQGATRVSHSIFNNSSSKGS